MRAPSGCSGGQLADARRHADGVGDGLRVDVRIARIRRVGHRRAPRLPSEVAGRERRAPATSTRAHRAGRGRVDERREPDPGEHDRPDVERQQVPRGLVRDGREDRRGDDDVAGEVARPEARRSGTRAESGRPHARHRAGHGQREHQPLAPRQAAGRRVGEQAEVVVPRVRVAGRGRCRDRGTCRRRGTARGRRPAPRGRTSRTAPRPPPPPRGPRAPAAPIRRVGQRTSAAVRRRATTTRSRRPRARRAAR